MRPGIAAACFQKGVWFAVSRAYNGGLVEKQGRRGGSEGPPGSEKGTFLRKA
jgi:hypothetical protein